MLRKWFRLLVFLPIFMEIESMCIQKSEQIIRDWLCVYSIFFIIKFFMVLSINPVGFRKNRYFQESSWKVKNSNCIWICYCGASLVASRFRKRNTNNKTTLSAWCVSYRKRLTSFLIQLSKKRFWFFSFGWSNMINSLFFAFPGSDITFSRLTVSSEVHLIRKNGLINDF